MPIKYIDIATLKQWIKQNAVVIIDVREPDEHAEIHIQNAILMPLATVCKAALPETEHKKIVIHCHAGVRSQRACDKLLAEDPSLELYNLEGGILAWSQVAD